MADPPPSPLPLVNVDQLPQNPLYLPADSPTKLIQLPPRTTVMTASNSSSGGSPKAPATATGKHPTYRGIRSRSGKWVSEIREPRKSKRIWLGTYPTPEMAAAAYDVAALSLKGGDAVLNFPDFVGTYPVPAFPEPGLIRNAAVAAAGMMKCSGNKKGGGGAVESAAGGGDTEVPAENEFVDLEDLFDMPNLLADMAEGMLMSPPRQPDESPQGDSSDCDNLWSY
ncbi:hypothetical protein L6452_16190 [Arctium lappa]|uniref:Uncharacterized protein n=1 Tax=Arctium lappa TaxID=4217 RepID=A0ACB9BZX1_ARCLA|nr:hypothetical protein L6452_16190 [Arctium lappa]